MAKKTALDKGDKSEKRGSSADKHSGDKTPEPEKNSDEPGVLEPYTATGNFETDFCELCMRAGFPSMKVITRPQRPSLATPTENTTSTGKSDKNSYKDDPVKQDDGISPGEEEELQPTTYVIKGKYSYFQPRVEVEVDDEGGKTNVKEIYIRGWKIDDCILEIFMVTFPPLDKLTKIDFWNNGLTDSIMNTLASVLQNLPNLRTLYLDNNPLILQRYGAILGEESTIQNLSLRNCYVSDMGAKMIGNALTTNKSLVSLNLCFNKLTCEGVGNLFKGLRMNRTLLSLNLGSNLISDAGASKIAEVISCFSLTHEEIIARRLLISKKSPDEITSPSRSLNAPTGGSKERPASVRSGGHLSKEERKSRGEKDRPKKKEGKKQDDKAKKAASIESVKIPAKGKKSAATKGDKKGFQQPEQEQPEVLEFTNPLLEMPLKEEGGDIIIPGNRALININLSRNEIGETGVEAFLIAIQRQMELVSMLSKPTGLMRLTLLRNSFSRSNGSYQRLIEIMQARDPNYKPSEPPDDLITTIKEDP